MSPVDVARRIRRVEDFVAGMEKPGGYQRESINDRNARSLFPGGVKRYAGPKE